MRHPGIPRNGVPCLSGAHRGEASESFNRIAPVTDGTRLSELTFLANTKEQFRRVPVELDEGKLKEQIARCRRLARDLADEEMRQSLENLAAEYEAKLRCTSGGFMLRRKSD